MRFLGPTIVGSIAATALLIAGCGGGSGGSSSASAAKPASGGALVNASSTAVLGDIVVGPSGRTLYLFQKDTGPKSTCSGACAGNWPPLTTTGKLTTSGGVSSSALKTIRRTDGTMQVTFAGHPLYYFSGDSSPGDAKGQGLDAFGAKWYALTPAGKQVTSGAQAPSSGY
jgi:predicted lipoprotein with Yx(FWY)xxD motif